MYKGEETRTISLNQDGESAEREADQNMLTDEKESSVRLRSLDW